MSDTTTPAAPAPDLQGLSQDQINQLLASLHLGQGLPNIQPDRTPVDSSGFGGGLRHVVSLLGEFAGSPGPETLKALSPAEREQAGIQALSRFGTGLLQASGSGQWIGTNLGNAFAHAERGYDTTTKQALGALAAKQGYAVEDQRAQLDRLKAALPLLSLQAQQRAADAARAVMGGGTPGSVAPSTNIATGGSISVPPELLPIYQEASARTGIPVDVLIAQGKQESGFNPNAVGGAGEIGVHQIKPSTAKDPGFGLTGIDPATLKDPRVNINFAADYLKARGGPRTDFSNPATVAAALKNYNGGGDPNYVANVLRYVPGARASLAGATAPSAAPGAAVPPAQLGGDPGAPVQIPPAVQVAGPGAGTVPSAPPPRPPRQGDVPWVPGEVGPAGPRVPTGQLVPPLATAPSVSPPAVVTPATDASAQAPFNPADVSVRYGPLPPDLTARPTITPEEDADIQRQVAIAMPQLDAAKQLAEVVKQRRELISAKVEKQNTDVRAFRANEAKTQVDEAAKQAAEVRAAAQKQQDQAQQQANAVELERIKSGFTVDQQGALVALEGWKDQMKKSAETATAMGPVSDQLRQLPALMRQLPPGGLISSLLGQYPTIAAVLKDANIISPETADNISVFTGLTNHLSTQLRVSGTGSMSDRDLDTFKSVMPRLLQSDAGRRVAVAFLQNMADRVVEGNNFTQDYFSRIDPATGKPAHNLSHLPDVIERPRRIDANGINQGGLGPVLPEAPRFEEPNSYKKTQDWLRENVKSGHPYTAWRPDEKGNLTQQIMVRE
jgi:soluble lytic murein transglycosylase-like protein